MTTFLRLVLMLSIANIIYYNASSQSFGINTTGAPAATSSILDVSSTDKGMLIPRMSKTERNAIATPATGLMVFQNAPDSTGFYYYDGTAWQWLATQKGSIGWLTTGNAGTTLANSFFGTTDSVPLSFRQKNNWLGRWDNVTNNYFIGDSSGIAITSGLNNIGIGSRALFKNTSAYANVAIGNSALQNNTTSLRNTVIGDSAMFSQSYNPGGTYFSDNTAIGSKAMYSNDPTASNNGVKNTAIGSEAMYQNTTGVENTAIGVSALRENTTGSFNTVIGRSANRLSKTGQYNSYVGYATGLTDSIGTGNSGLGAYALYSHQRNNFNTAVGFETMEYDSAGALNTAIGWRALRNNKTGYENTALGVGALEYDSTGNYNTGVGRYAGFSPRRGDLNIWMGYASGYSADTATLSTSVGAYSGYYNKMDYTTAFGAYSLTYNGLNATTNLQGIENTGLGYGASYLNRTGSKNVAVGFQSMNGNGFVGSYNRNIAVGDSALFSISSANNNVAVGFKAAASTQGASDNIAIGQLALNKNVSGNQHVAVGSRALYNATANYPNTAVGYSSQDSATTGYANTAVGSYSLTKNKLGYNNTAIGNAAMYEAYNPSGLNYPYDNTAVGNDALRYTRYYGQVAIGSGALRNDTSGIYNTALGYLAMYQNLSGSGNAVLGSFAMYKNKLSGYNTAVGYNSLYSHTITGSNFNTALGSFAMEQDSSGFQNTGVGTSVFRNNVSGFQNTGVGINAGYWQKQSNNTFVGAFSGVGERAPGNNYAADIGYNNTGLGAFSMNRIANGNNNVAVGYYSLYSDSSGIENAAVGYSALYQNLSGQGNAVLGSYSMYKNKLSSYNTAMGYNSLYNHNTSNWDYNTAMGSFALEQDSSGFQNTGVGTSAFRFNVSGFLNTGVGINAGYYQKQSYNTFLGAYCGVGERFPSTDYASDTGRYNTAIGGYSMHRAANAGYNVAVGFTSLYNDSSGVNNVAVGYGSLNNITTGTDNTAIGYSTNVSSSALTNSTAVGAYAYAGLSNTMVLGSISGLNGASTTVNVGIGENRPVARLHVKRSGSSGGTFLANSSVIIEDNAQSYLQLSNPTNAEAGMLSGNALTPIRSGMVFSVDSSVYLRSGGNNTRMTIYNNGNIGIGTTIPATKLHIYESSGINVNARIATVNSTFDPGLELVKTGAGVDWKMRVDNGNLLTFSRATDDFVAVPTDYYEMSTNVFRPANDVTCTLGGAGNRWTTVYASNGVINTSDIRDKENIENLGYGLTEIMKLRPVSFNWKENPQWGRKIGFIAQEVKPILSEVVQTGQLKSKTASADEKEVNSDKLGIYYSDIIPVAVKAIQEQQLLIEKQAKENAELREKNAQLEKDIQLIKEKLGIKN